MFVYVNFQIEDLERILRFVLTKNSLQHEKLPLKFNSYRKPYWIINELEKFIPGFCKSSLDQFLDKLQHGNEVSFTLEDPWPFLALHYLHLPIWVLRKALKGQNWTYEEFIVSKFGVETN